MESLWLLATVLIPLAFLDRDFAASEAVISYVEVPKIALLRTLVGLMCILWLIEWGIRGRLHFGSFFGGLGPSLRLKDRLRRLRAWLSERPTRWLFLAVWFFLGTTLLSTVLSGSFNVSMWGEVPGQDGYPSYTIVAYVLLFAVIATHLKTRAQLWRILGAITVLGTLIAGYGILQHYGRDFLDLTETTGGGRRRVTSFMGNTIFAAAAIMMAIPISLATGTMSLRRPAAATGSVRWRAKVWVAAFGVAGLWGVVLAIQLLGITFTFSRGPWLGLMLSLLGFLGLATMFAGWRTVGRAVLVLELAAVLIIAVLQGLGSISILGVGRWLGVIFVLVGFLGVGAVFVNWRVLNRAVVVLGVPAVLTVAVVLGASWFRGDVGTGVNPSTPSNPGAESESSEVAQRLLSVKGEVLSGLGGRGTHWKVSWQLIRDRPWVEFDSLSLSWLRPLIGYGPDLFRYTYLLRSPAEGVSLFPLEPDHAHNYFIHQTVEQGVLGLLSSLGIFAAVFIAGVYQLIRYGRSLSTFHRVVLVALLAVVAGRFFEMMLGVARVSDLTVLWVLLAVFAALPLAMSNSESGKEAPNPHPRSIKQRRRSRSGNASRPRSYDWGLFWRLAVVAWLIGGIAVLTWVKSINYVRAAVEVGEGLEHYRQGDFQATLASLDQAIDLAPDVSLYYNHRANVYLTYQLNQDLPPERGCSTQKDLPYAVCLAARSFQSNLEAVQQRPFYYRSRLALANSAYNIPELKEVTVRLYRESLALAPNSWVIRNELAAAYLEAGQPKAALEVLEESLAITGDNIHSAETYFLQGRAFLSLHQPEPASLALERALELRAGLLDKSALKAHLSLAEFYASESRFDRQIAHLNDAINLDPQNAVVSGLRSQLASAIAERGLASAEKGRPEIAIEDYGSAIQLDPQNAGLYVSRSKAYIELGQLAAAEGDFNKAMVLDPQVVADKRLDITLSQSLVELGHGFFRLGQHFQAFDHYDRAVRIGHRNAEAYLSRGNAYRDLVQSPLYDRGVIWGSSVFSPVLTEDYGVEGGSTVRFVIPHARISSGGDGISITFRSRDTAYGFVVNDVFVGHAAASGAPWDFDGNQVQVTWDGGIRGVQVRQASSQTSDTVAFPLTPGKDLIIAWNTEAGRLHGFKFATGVAGVQGYTMPLSQTARDRAPAGLSPLQPGLLLGISDITIASRPVDFKSTSPRLASEAPPDNPRIIWFNERAIEDYDQAIRIDPNLAEAYYNRGKSYAELGLYQLANGDFEQAVRLNPKTPAGLPRP
jgi:tetratricopeptide (TPR) repeat protein